MVTRFEEFYKNTYRYAYVFFSSRIFDQSIIDDLCQESFIRFYKKFGNDPDENSTRLLMGFCKNIYKEFVYKSQKESRVSFNDDIDYKNLLENISSENPVKAKQLALIASVLPKLNPRIRDIIEYRFIYNMSRKEVAELLGMKERDVLKYQQRGIQYIKKFLE